MTKDKKFILWFNEIDMNDVALVGGKNASLGEMYQKLSHKGIKVPNGFAVTAYAYNYFIEKAGIGDKIKNILKDVNTSDINDLRTRGYQTRDAILMSNFPSDLEKEIIAAYKKMSKEYGEENIDTAVRSSATAEDLPDASFAGQQETYLNVRGVSPILDATKKCFASLFTNRAISYREDKDFDHFEVSLSVGIQKMVRSDLESAGVAFSIDTESGFKNAAVITGAWGLGEMVVQGKVDPDEYIIFKPTLKEGIKGENGDPEFLYKPIVEKKLGSKSIKMIYTSDGSVAPEGSTKETIVSKEKRRQFVLNDSEILKIAYWVTLIEEHYKKPMDVEWAKDGKTGELFIVQARPETVQSQNDKRVLKEYVLEEKGKILTEGVAVGGMIGVGKANVIKHVADINKFKKGEVLVTEITDPDWEPIMKIASGIVTNSGGRTSHAAIVSRELGIPAIVGAGNATMAIKTEEEITVSCAEGETGYVYKGALKYKINETDLSGMKLPKTNIMMIVADTSRAFDFAQIPNKGVGLAREELIILNHIKIHPLALLHFDKLKDENVKREIEEITLGYKNKIDFFVDKLASGIGKITAAFYPHDVIVRMSDFKSNEYANLLGGRQFEPHEENPMLGWRGASRYYSNDYKDAFILECRALKRVREEMGLKNMKAMIPFCRTPEEGRKVIKIMADNGLKQGEDGFEIYVMCEIPSNVILAEEFAEIFDGFSIGSNDLTQLTMGLDRDGGLISHIADERNEAVKQMIAQAIKIAHEKNRKIGICGQGPSDFPEFAQFLVEQGIDSIALNPDSVIKTTLKITETEEKLKK